MPRSCAKAKRAASRRRVSVCLCPSPNCCHWCCAKDSFRDLSMTGEQNAPSGAHSVPKAYVIGAGLAGLSAATILAARGVSVTLIEAAGQAGGRCRSYFDSVMDGVIDNGNHLVLSGNHAVHAYLARIGAHDALAGPPRAEFTFVDLRG